MRIDRQSLKLDLYAALGVSARASTAEIRAAYRRGARASHPDRNPGDPNASARMARLNAAARVLLDPEARSHYDALRSSRSVSRTGARRAAAAADSGVWWEERSSGGGEWTIAAVRGLTQEVRLALTFTCILLGSALIALARPRNAFWVSAPEADADMGRAASVTSTEAAINSRATR